MCERVPQRTASGSVNEQLVSGCGRIPSSCLSIARNRRDAHVAGRETIECAAITIRRASHSRSGPSLSHRGATQNHNMPKRFYLAVHASAPSIRKPSPRSRRRSLTRCGERRAAKRDRPSPWWARAHHEIASRGCHVVASAPLTICSTRQRKHLSA